MCVRGPTYSLPLLLVTIDGAQKWHDLGLDEGRVDDLGTLVSRVEAPHQKRHLADEVKGDEVDEWLGDALDELEEGKHQPVSEPLRVVILVVGLNGLDGRIGRIEVGHQVNHKVPPAQKKHEDHGQADEQHSDVLLLLLRRAGHILHAAVEHGDALRHLLGAFLKGSGRGETGWGRSDWGRVLERPAEQSEASKNIFRFWTQDSRSAASATEPATARAQVGIHWSLTHQHILQNRHGAASWVVWRPRPLLVCGDRSGVQPWATRAATDRGWSRGETDHSDEAQCRSRAEQAADGAVRGKRSAGY